IDLNEVEQPIVVALSSQEPVLFRAGSRSQRRPRTPFGVSPFLAVPLRRSEVDATIGLLLVAGVESPPEAELAWATQILSAKILCLRFEGARRREQRAQRQRDILRQMVDAVSDPILVTNDEGQILEANAHAE